jgi:hypothetical protein
MCDDGVGTTGHPQDVEEICDGKEIDEEEEAEQEEELVPTFGEAVGAFEVLQRHLTSFNVDNECIGVRPSKCSQHLPEDINNFAVLLQEIAFLFGICA